MEVLLHLITLYWIRTPDCKLTTGMSSQNTSGYFLLLWITVTSWTTLRTGSIAQQYPHVKDIKCIRAVCKCNVKNTKVSGCFQECIGKLQIKFSSLDPQIQTSHLVEYYSCDWLACRSQVIMLTVDSGGGRRRRIKTANKMSQKMANSMWRRQVVLFNSQQSQWKHLTSLETNETLFEAIAFLFEIQLAVGLFLPLLFISTSN